MTAVLGGGLSGLSAAYYALENPRLGPIVLLEASNRLGGWVSTKKSPTGAIFEQGPRTIRPGGDAGKNTLNLIDNLKLSNKIHPISTTDPAAINRFIYADQILHPLPISFKPLFITTPPFKRPLIKAIWNDLYTLRVPADDESLYSFIERRLGKDIADYFISPMICGICAGDAKQISVNFLMPSLFKAEQKYGSIFKGMLKEKLFAPPTSSNKEAWEVTSSNSPGKEKSIGSAERSVKSNWAIWALEGGLEQLPQALASNLYSRNMHIRLGTECKELTFKPDCVELRASSETKKFERVISSLPAQNLARLVENQHPDLAKELKAIPTVTVAVVNLEFSSKVLPMEAFGFLVPPKEGLPILGVIFDSCIIPQETTVLTVMMGGVWFEKYFGTNSTEKHLLSVAVEQVKTILKIKESPHAHSVSILKDCIPQHIVGHNQRIDRIRDYISKHKLPLGLCGSSYEGVGVNDVILSAKKAVISMDGSNNDD